MARSRKDELTSIFWDMYKDVHGFRPHHIDCSAMTEAQLEAELNELDAQGKIVFEEERQAEERAKVRAEQRIADTIACGAQDRATALRWIHDAERTNGDDEFLCYTLGVPYGYFKKIPSKCN